MLTANWDAKNDILYVNFEDTGNSYGDEIESGLIQLYDMDSLALTGVTIFDFRKKRKNKNLPDRKLLGGMDPESIIPLLENFSH